MYIFHINRNFFTNRIHSNIFQLLQDNDVIGNVFVYHYGEYTDLKDVPNYVILVKLQKFYRYLPIFRSFTLAILILRKGMTRNAIIHAHTLCSDGFVAFFLSLLGGYRYLCTVRNTDVNSYLHKAKILIPFIKMVVKKASKIVFLTPSYQKKLTIMRNQSKAFVLPSFLESHWESKMEELKTTIDGKKRSFLENRELKFVYVGRLTKSKKVLDMAQFFLFRKIKLAIYGAGPEETAICKLCEASNGLLTFYGSIENEVLPSILEMYNVSISFSRFESFGLSFVESLFAGVIPIFNKGEGIDGFFDWLDTAVAMDIPEEVDRIINHLYDNYITYLDSLQETDLRLFTKQSFILNYKKLISSF